MDLNNENLNTAVFTTASVVIKKSPIVYISHDDDGAWQFFSTDEVPASEAMLVSLKEIIELDLSVVEVLSMPINHFASRKNKDSKWIIQPLN